ncbi:MAG TPA: Ig-like domain-containing protein [Kofleriaceae bacterium]
MNRPSRYCVAASLLAALAACGTVSSPGGDDDGDDNQPPVATPAELSTWTSTPIVGRLAGEDPDGEPLTFTVAGEPTGGTLLLDEDGSFVYTPAPGTSGADAFSFVVDDSRDTSEEAIVDISIATLTDGTPDETFGEGGATISDFGESDAFSGVVVHGDGRIAAVGSSASDLAVVAGYSNRGGSLNSWGEGGSGSTMLNLGGYDGFGDVVQEPGGRLVSVGQTQGETGRDFMLLGLTDDNGLLDSSFGEGGVTVTDVAPGRADVANALTLLPDGRLLVAGYANNGTDDDFAVARYSQGGVLDDTFGTGGFAIVDFGGTDRVNDVALDGAGNILLVGEAVGEMGIARLTPEGDPDSGFGAGGKVRLDRGGMAEAIGVAVGSDGSIIVGGNSEEAGGVWTMAAVRLTPTGELDAGFGEDGWALATPASADTYAMGMLLLPNQTLLLVGGWTSGDVTEAAAARLVLSTGQLDPGFGDAGFFHQAFGEDGNDILFAAALQPDGKVVAVGWSRNANLDALLVRLGW